MTGWNICVCILDVALGAVCPQEAPVLRGPRRVGVTCLVWVYSLTFIFLVRFTS